MYSALPVRIHLKLIAAALYERPNELPGAVVIALCGMTQLFTNTFSVTMTALLGPLVFLWVVALVAGSTTIIVGFGLANRPLERLGLMLKAICLTLYCISILMSGHVLPFLIGLGVILHVVIGHLLRWHYLGR